MADSVLISIISAVSGIVVTFITVRYKNQTAKPKAKNRIDTAYDMLEGIIKNLNAEIERKDKIILQLTIENERLKEST